MTKRWLFPLMVILIVAVTGISWWMLDPHQAEPVYQGKPESYWVELVANMRGRDFKKNWEDLGTNGLPVLLKAVERKSNPIRTAYRKAWPKMPAWVKSRWRRPSDDSQIRTNALVLLSNWGDSKALLPLLKAHKNPLVRDAAANGLVSNADNMVTLGLIEALNDQDPRVRESAAFAMCLDAREDSIVTPACMKHINDGDPKVRFFVAAAVYIRPDNRTQVLPVLVEGLKSKDPDIRFWAELVLKDASPEELKDAGINK